MKSVIFSSSYFQKSQYLYKISSLFKRVKVAITKLLAQKSSNNNTFNNVIAHQVQKNFSFSINNSYKERQIIKTKQLHFIEDVVQKLEVINYKKLEQMENREKIKMFVDLVNLFQIIKNRLSISTFSNKISTKRQLQQERQIINKEIQHLQKLLLDSDIFYKKQNEEEQNQNNNLDSPNIKYKNSQHKSQHLTLTRPSSAYLNYSAVFMNSYLKNIKQKQSQLSYSQYKNPQIYPSKEHKYSKSFLKCETSKLNNRNTMEIHRRRDSAKPHKSLSIRKEYQHLLIKPQSTQQILDQNSQCFQSKLKDKSKSRNQSEIIQTFKMSNYKDKIKNMKQTNKMIKFASINQQQKSLSRKTFRREQEGPKGILRGTSKKTTLNQTFDKKSRKYFQKSKNSKGKLRKGHVKHKKTINFYKKQIYERQSSQIQQPQSFQVIIIQPLQKIQIQKENVEYQNQLKRQSSSHTSNVNILINSQSELKPSFNSIRFSQQQKQNQNQKQDQMILNKSKRRRNCNFIKRNAQIYKQQDLLPLKLQIISKQLLNQNSLIQKTNIFAQLLQINEQMKKQNFSAFFKQQEKLKQFQQAYERKKQKVQEVSTNLSDFIKTFKMKYSESSNKISNIKFNERLYSFLSDQEWIKHNWETKCQNQLIQSGFK